MKPDPILLRHLVEAEGLTSKQIGQRLGISPSSVGWYRSYYGIRTPDRTWQHFDQVYAPKGGSRQFRAMVRRAATMREIAAHFGFSFQYAQQLCHKLLQQGLGTALSDDRAARPTRT